MQNNIEKIITKNLDLWTSSLENKSSAGRGTSNKINLHGIQKLRDLILDLAVRGKLIPQDPNDEPASELLKKIGLEKRKLVKEGKIKKQKPLSEVTEEEISFYIPDSWEWSRLQEVSTYIQRGKGPKYSEEGKVRVVSQKCIQWKGFNIEPSRYVDDKSLKSYQSERYLQKNDLLWNSTGTGTVGRVNCLELDAEGILVADSHVTVIRLEKVQSRFICIYISSPQIQNRIDPNHDNSLVSGSTKQVELNTSKVSLLAVPIPPLSEQKRIISKVEELMLLCDKLEKQTEDSLEAHKLLVENLLSALTNSKDSNEFSNNWNLISDNFDILLTTEHSVDELQKTILQLAVMGKLVPQDPNDEPASELLKRIKLEKEKLIKEGKIKKQKPLPKITEEEKPFEIPDGWEWTRLGLYGEVFSGNSFKSEDFNDVSGVKVIKITNAGVHEFIETKEYLPKTFADKYKQFIVYKNDLILALTRPYISSGLKISKCPLSYDKSLLNQRVAGIRTKGNVNFLFLYLRSEFVLSFYQNKFGNSGLQPNLKVSDVTDLLFPIPPEAEQKRIVAKVDELTKICEKLKDKISESQGTKNDLANTLVEKLVA